MSSYKQNSYGRLFTSLTQLYKPKTIIEIGILEGYSLSAFLRGASSECSVRAYDIFDAFPYHHAKYEDLRTKYGEDIIQYGDFWQLHKNIKAPIDMLHIDIANDGDVYEHCFKHYLPLMSDRGIILLEGGSEERDNYYWMKEFNKRSIRPVLQSSGLDYIVLEPFPSITIISVSKES